MNRPEVAQALPQARVEVPGEQEEGSFAAPRPCYPAPADMLVAADLADLGQEWSGHFPGHDARLAIVHPDDKADVVPDGNQDGPEDEQGRQNDLKIAYHAVIMAWKCGECKELYHSRRDGVS